MLSLFRTRKYTEYQPPCINLRQQSAAEPSRPPWSSGPHRGQAAWQGGAGGTQGSRGTQPARQRGCRRQGLPWQYALDTFANNCTHTKLTHPSLHDLSEFPKRAPSWEWRRPGVSSGTSRSPSFPSPSVPPRLQGFLGLRWGSMCWFHGSTVFPQRQGSKPSSAGSCRPRAFLGACLCAGRHWAQGRESRVAGTPPTADTC